MAKDDKVDEPVVEENKEEPKDPVVELDKPTDIEGELIQNPTLEEEDESEPEADESSEGTPAEGESDPAVQPAEKLEPDSAEPPEEPEQTVPVPDPGEFQPKGDYSFDVQTADGKTLKIKSQAEADAFASRLDSEEGLITASQFLQFNRNVSKMDNGIAREESDFLEQKQTYDNEQAQEQARTDQTVKWSNELKYLEGKDLLPKIAPGVDVPGGWQKNPDDPGVKARMEIFNWMDTENADRRAAGVDEIKSTIDAQRLMAAESTEQTAKTEKAKEADTRRAKGSMVTGNAPFTPDNSTGSGMIIGEGGTLNDLVREASMPQ